MHHCPRWIHTGVTILLTLALAACNRSASNAMTPLPSAPPPTPTSISETQVSPTLSSASVTVTVTTVPPTALTAPTATPSSTKSLPVATATAATVTATATKASIATEVTCGSALPSRLRLNSFAYVNPDPPLPNNLRNEAGKNNELIGEIQPGQAMKILDGPKCVDGWLWWKVGPLNSDLTGWTAEGDDRTYWLVPCSSEKECGT